MIEVWRICKGEDLTLWYRGFLAVNYHPNSSLPWVSPLKSTTCIPKSPEPNELISSGLPNTNCLTFGKTSAKPASNQDMPTVRPYEQSNPVLDPHGAAMVYKILSVSPSASRIDTRASA